MRDRQLYEKILGIEKPWKVVGVDVDLEEGEVRVHVANLERKLPCPECGRLCGRYDARPRRWRHLDTCQYPTILIAEVPRIECEMDGVLQVRVPWAVAGSRFTALFESLVIDWLKEASISAVARLYRLSWDEVDGIQQRAVRRGLIRRRRQLPALPKHLGVDETSFRRRHQYVTVVLDQDEDIVVHLADGRGRDTLDGFFDEFSRREREAVESVAMDMHGRYITAVSTAIPDAGRKIAFDRFHIARHMLDAVDKVRRREHKELKAETINPLTGTRYVWLQNPERMEIERLLQLDALKSSCRKTARAWAIKELARSLWHYAVAAGRAKPGSSGTDGPSVRASRPCVALLAWSSNISKASSTLSSSASPTPAVKRSTPRSSGSSTPPAASATGRGSVPLSTSI